MTTDTRIESLETQVRSLKRMLFGVCGVVVVGGLLAATTLQSIPDVIRAKKFEVVNDDNQVAVTLETDQGYGHLWFYSKEKNILAAIWAEDEGGFVGVGNSSGKLVAKVEADSDGGVVTVLTKEEIPVVSLFADENGTGHVVAGLCTSLSESDLGMEDEVREDQAEMAGSSGLTQEELVKLAEQMYAQPAKDEPREPMTNLESKVLNLVIEKAGNDPRSGLWPFAGTFTFIHLDLIHVENTRYFGNLTLTHVQRDKSFGGYIYKNYHAGITVLDDSTSTFFEVEPQGSWEEISVERKDAPLEKFHCGVKGT